MSIVPLRLTAMRETRDRLGVKSATDMRGIRMRYLRLHHNPVYALTFRFFIVLKLLRRALTRKVPFSLAGFVLIGAPGKKSLRFR